jgi:GT2 family glycosyltransferase
MRTLAPARPDVSVVIPGASRWELTAGCLASLHPALETSSASVEVVYVDDASEDATVPQLRSRYPSLRIERLASRTGFSEAANRGVRVAKAPIVVLLNNDVEVGPGFLDPLIRHFENGTVFAVTADSIVDGKHESVSRGTFRGGLFHVVQPVLQDLAPLPAVTVTNFHMSGGFSAVDREKFLSLGGFPRAYSPFYWEDVELSWRAWRRGWTVLFEPQSRVQHKGHATIAALYSQPLRRFVYERNRLLFIWRNIRDERMFDEHLEYLLRGRTDELGKGLQGPGMRFHFVPEGIRRALTNLALDDVRLADREILAGCCGQPWPAARKT